MASAPARFDFSYCGAIVTGGNRGIGLAITRALRSSGARVVVWDREVNEAEGEFVSVDIRDATSVKHALHRSDAELGGLDILVNNAGYAGATAPVEHYDRAEWDRIIDINLNGTFLVCQGAIPRLRRNGWGRVVNIASLAGKEGTPNAAAYSAAKAGIIALTKSMGKELAGTGILVNAIAPAAVRTPLLEQMSEEHVAIMVAKSPLARLGEPEEVTDLVLWLCSSSCSFSTGAVFDLSGGRATY